MMALLHVAYTFATFPCTCLWHRWARSVKRESSLTWMPFEVRSCSGDIGWLRTVSGALYESGKNIVAISLLQ